MAVELRCPECRAKLRLSVAPEPDSEVECPKCGHVFPCDDNRVHAGAADADRPVKKKPRDDGAQAEAKPEAKPEGKPAAEAKPFKRKKRRAKKRKTKPAVIVAIVVVAVIVIGSVAGALIWFFTKKSASQQMITYLPDDCDEVSGINIGHLQKYPEFYKTCEQTFGSTGFKQAADLFAKVLGQQTNDVLDYVVQGSGPSGEATVLRTKEEYDTDLLGKFPGAKPYTQDGVTYYTITDIPGLGYGNPRVFAPTNRLVVFCPGTIPPGKFAAMLTGNKDGETVLTRAAPLAKQTIRGTAWKFMVYPPEGRVQRLAPPAPKQGGEGGAQETEDDLFRKEIADILSTAQGCGVKASVGSREVRGEFVVWYKDSDAAANMLKKWKEREWVKDEEKDPPRWWKTMANKTGGGKTAPNVIRDGLAFRSRGEVFIIRSSMETNLLKNGVSTLVGSFTGQQSGIGTPPGGIPFPGGGGGPPGGIPGAPGGGGPPPGRRRRPVGHRGARLPGGA